jgi:hypothetical protein
MHQTIERRFNSGRSFCHPVQRRFSHPRNITVRPLRAVFYGFETWFFILRAQHRLRVCEKSFRTARETAVGRRPGGGLHNEELHDSCCSLGDQMQDGEMNRACLNDGK